MVTVTRPDPHERTDDIGKIILLGSDSGDDDSHSSKRRRNSQNDIDGQHACLHDKRAVAACVGSKTLFAEGHAKPWVRASETARRLPTSNKPCSEVSIMVDRKVVDAPKR